MTAEVAVLNRIGVALAADSAVTIGRDASKIYTSAEKLFQLSSSIPIGIMVYGNADFCGLPWETIIKTYRTSHGSDTFESVVSAGDRFIEFLSNARELFPQERQERHVEDLLGGFLLFVREQIGARFDAEAEKKDGLASEDLPPIIEDEVENILKLIQRQDYLPGFNEDSRKKCAEQFEGKLNTLLEQVFGTLPFSEGATNNVKASANEMLVRHFFGPLECGVVIGGFGTNEFMPSLINYQLEEIASDVPRAIKTLTYTVGDDSNAAVFPFAQKDMVQSFMEGIHSELHAHMTESTSGLFQGAIESILGAVSKHDKKLAEELREAAASGLDDMLTNLFQHWDRRRAEYWQPVVEIVASLPKDELAAMAEALVNLSIVR